MPQRKAHESHLYSKCNMKRRRRNSREKSKVFAIAQDEPEGATLSFEPSFFFFSPSPSPSQTDAAIDLFTFFFSLPKSICMQVW